MALLALLLSRRAAAEPLRVDRSAETMRVDGALREWKGAHFSTLGSGQDASLRYALATQGDGLYLALEVQDDKHVRGEGVGPGQDAVVLALAFPAAGGRVRTREIWLHAGQVGRAKAAAGVRMASAPASVLTAPLIRVVEAPLSEGSGYTLEAYVPWQLFESDAANWEAARAVLRYDDVDRAGDERAETLASTNEARATAWPAIALGAGQVDLLASFLKSQALTGVVPRFDVRANVAGDETDERVVIVDKFVLVYGKRFKDGQSYSFYALPYSIGGGLVAAELLDLTGDGRAELLVRVRQANALGARVLLSVLSLGEDRIAPLFAAELKKEAQGGFLESLLRIDEKARPKRLEFSVGRAQGLTPENYRESPAADALPLLLPWGELESVTYAFDGVKFARVAERAAKRAAAAASAAHVAAAPAAGVPAAPLTPVVPSGDPIAELVLALARDASAGSSVRFNQQANVCPGTRKERVFAWRGRIVVSGPDLGAAGAYLAYGLSLAAEQDLLGIESADLGSDGSAELLVRYRSSGATDVVHELLLVLACSAGAAAPSFQPLLVAEVARRQGPRAVLNEVRVERGVLTIGPGAAQGYTRETYPFDNRASQGVDRLLLPWLDKSRRYRLTDGRLRGEP